MQHRTIPLGLVVSVALLLAACSTLPTTRFYTLAPAAKTVQKPLAAAPIYIEVPPVSMPERLMRPQMLLRSDGTQVEILEQQRWSSPFNNELHDALAASLANWLGAVDVTRAGRPANAPVYRIIVELRQFDAVPGEKVELQFGWTILRSDLADNAPRVSCGVHFLEPLASTDIAAVVQALQHSVTQVAAAIAVDLLALGSGCQ